MFVSATLIAQRAAFTQFTWPKREKSGLGQTDPRGGVAIVTSKVKFSNLHARIVSGAECLLAGSQISAGGCVVHLAGIPPSESLGASISTNAKTVVVFLPPRLKLLRRARDGSYSWNVGIGPSQKLAPARTINSDVGWYVQRGSARVTYVNSTGPKTSCNTFPVTDYYPRYFTAMGEASTNSKGLGGGCTFKATFEEFRFESVPMN